MGKAEDYIEEALAAYELGAPVVGSVRFGEGHINDTFCVHTQPPDGACRRFILQRISAAAFGNPEQLMRNVVGVTDYLKKVIAREGGNPDRETLTILRTRLWERAKQEQEAAVSDQRRSQVGSGMRNERIRTYNFPQGRVTDHRIGLTLYQIDAVMDGGLDPIIDALAAADRAERMSEQREDR